MGPSEGGGCIRLLLGDPSDCNSSSTASLNSEVIGMSPHNSSSWCEMIFSSILKFRSELDDSNSQGPTDPLTCEYRFEEKELSPSSGENWSCFVIMIQQTVPFCVAMKVKGFLLQSANYSEGSTWYMFSELSLKCLATAGKYSDATEWVCFLSIFINCALRWTVRCSQFCFSPVATTVGTPNWIRMSQIRVMPGH